MTLQDALKRARHNAGLTQKQLSEQFGTSEKTIKNWEQGKSSPSVPALIELADFYKCDLDYLTGRIDSRTHDLKFISEYTGLPETTIDQIQGLSETETMILSGIINHPNLKKILQTIADLTAYGQLDYDEKHAYSFAIESLTKQFDQENLIEYIYDPETGNIIDIKGEHNEYDPFQSTSTTLMENILIHAVLAAFEDCIRDISDTPIS